MKKSKIILILSIIAVLLIFVPATIFIVKTHNDSLRLVVEKKVKEAAELCFNEKKCENKKITLNELIEKGYIEKMYDPVSKELINLNSYVDLDKNAFEIVK